MSNLNRPTTKGKLCLSVHEVRVQKGSKEVLLPPDGDMKNIVVTDPQSTSCKSCEGYGRIESEWAWISCSECAGTGQVLHIKLNL